MTNLFQSLRRSTGTRSALDFQTWVDYFSYNGLNYGLTGGNTLGSGPHEIGGDFAGLIDGAYKSNGIVFACMLARQLLFSEARFQFRRVRQGRLGELWGSKALAPLEKPWAGATTGDLLARMIQDADLAGNFFAARKPSGIHRMRPDWVTIVVGSRTDEENPADALDAEIAGYLYHPGGPNARREPEVLMPEQVCHFAPIPDPAFRFRGMSWLGPVVTEVMADQSMTTHKRKFMENGATVNMVVTVDPSVKKEAFDLWVKKMKMEHEGVDKAYKTLYMGGGSDAKVVGSDMKQIDFKVTQGAGETRIAAAARIPPIIVGLSEGLEAATYSNYGQARRAFADGTMSPLWRNAAGSLASLIDVPGDSELWYDARDIPFLQEDQKDAADIQQVNAATINTLVTAGYDPETAVKAVLSGDLAQLKHTGLYSVQLQKPGTQEPATDPPDDPAARALRQLVKGSG